MEFRKRFSESLAGRSLAEALDDFQRDIEREFNMAINEKHAPIMVPRVTIDAAHAQVNSTTAYTGTNFNAAQTATTTSASFATAINYVGRGVLTKFLIAEVTSGGAISRQFGAKITIDGNVVYSDSNALTRETATRVIVGNLNGTVSILDEFPGLPFNQSCKLEFASDGTRTLTAAWKIAKKL